MAKETPSLLQPGADLLGLDDFDLGVPVAEALPQDATDAQRTRVYREVASDGLLLLPDDVVPSAVLRQREFLKCIEAGAKDIEAAAAVGVSRWMAWRWKKSDPEFLKAYEAAKVVHVDQLVKEAKRRALHGSDRLLEFLLCNLAPDQFKKAPDTKVDVNISNVAERLQAGRKRVGS